MRRDVLSLQKTSDLLGRILHGEGGLPDRLHSASSVLHRDKDNHLSRTETKTTFVTLECTEHIHVYSFLATEILITILLDEIL